MRIAITDGYSTGRFLAEKLRAAGASLVHVRSQKYFPDLIYKSFYPDHFDHDLGYWPDTSALIEELRTMKVTGVAAGSESGVPLADMLSHSLQLRGNSPRSSAARRSKAEMAQALRTAGLDHPRGAVVRTTEEAITWFTKQGSAEAIVKPLDSAGTDNVRICTGPAEVADATSAVLAAHNFFGVQNEEALVQECLAGREYFVNTVSVDGEHRVIETWLYSKVRGPSGAPIYDYYEPAGSEAAPTHIVHTYLKRALDALGVINGAAHSEVMLTNRGPVLIECGARLGGSSQPWVSEKYSGTSQVAVLAQYLLDPVSVKDFDDTKVRYSQPVRKMSLINHHPGTATAEDWIARISSLDTVIGVFPAVGPGASLVPTRDVVSSPGYVYLAAVDKDAIERDYRTIRQWEYAGLYTRQPGSAI